MMDGDKECENADVGKVDVNNSTEFLPTALLAFGPKGKDGDMQDGALASSCSAVAFL